MKNKSIFNENYFKILDYLEKAGNQGVDLNEKFDLSEKTFLKHITNLRKAGFKIIKKKEIYKLDKYFNFIELNDIEKSLLAHILTLSDTYLNKKKSINIENLINKIAHYSSFKNHKEIIEKFLRYKKIEFHNVYKERINILNNCIEKKEKITVILFSKREIELLPLDLIWKNEKFYITYKEEKLKKLAIEKIIKIIPSNAPKNKIKSNEVFFELYGNLAKSYLLKEDERIVDVYPDRIVIASSQNKNLLFKRLLRYDILCKVILPKKDVELFKTLILKTIDNLATLDTIVT